MPNKYMAKITVKMPKSKMLHFAMKIWPWREGQDQMVQWDQMSIFPQAFQIIKPVSLSHQTAEISRFMWKWPWPQCQGHCFEMSHFFCIGWKSLPCHSRICKARLNPLRIDRVKTLWKWSNFAPLTHFLRSRDDLEGWISHFLKCLVGGYLWAKNDVSTS